MKTKDLVQNYIDHKDYINNKDNWKQISQINNTQFWYDICSEGFLTDEFIEHFKDKVDWFGICQCQLSEDFIRKYQDRVNWREIFIRIKLSDEFKKEFENKLK
jgi:hypothetical protein